MARRAILGATALALVAVLAGCGDDGDGEEVSSGTPLDLASAVAEVGSATWRMHMEGTFPVASDGSMPGAFGTMRVVADLEGATDYDAGASAGTGTTEYETVLPEGAVDETPPPAVLHIEVRVLGDREWTRAWSGGAEPPGWDLYDRSGSTGQDTRDERVQQGDGGEAGDEVESLSSLLDPTKVDPVAVVELIRQQAGDLAEAGEDELDGEPVTRYEGTVEVAEDDEGLWAEDEGRGAIAVWVDAQGRLRRLVAGGLELVMGDFGSPVEVEEPSPVVDDDEAFTAALGLAEVTGDWAVEATGSLDDGRTWTVFAAPAEQGDVKVTCRTLEVAVDEREGDHGGPFGTEELAMEDVVPHHDGVPATCGGGQSLGFGGSAAITDPALQVLLSGGGIDEEGLVGLVVSRRFDGPLRVVAGGRIDEVPLDAHGIAVMGRARLEGAEALELDGGAVRCPVPDEGGDDDGVALGFLFSFVLPPCVRA